MKPITQEWVNKAEGDFATAQRELQVEQMPNYDAVCFHSQQCAEKYLKACLQEEIEGESMRLSKYVLKEMGYKEHSADDILGATFHLIKIYSIQGFVFDKLEEIQQTSSIPFGQICTAIIGSNVNAISNTLLEGDFVEDEEEWKASPPFLFLHFGPTEPYQIKGGFRKEENGEIDTYDCFPDARKQLNDWEDQFLAPIMTSLSVEFSSPGKPVNFVPISREVFAKTNEGEVLYDTFSQTNGIAYVSKKIRTEQFNSLLCKSSDLHCKLDTKISRNFYMGLEEEDKFKQFIYFFLFIETYTHYIFKNIDPDKCSKKLALESPIEWQDAKNLTQRFQWCSIFVWEDIVDEDIKKFKELKKIRNKISHGEDVNEVKLPVGIARELASKLLKGSNHADKS